MFVAGGSGTVRRVCTAVGDGFETTDRVADTTLAVSAGAIVICGTKMEKIGEDDAKDGERRET